VGRSIFKTLSTLHVHLDESGSPKFTAQSSRYYVFATVWTYDPSPLALELTTLRFKLLREGHDISHFHAQKDRQHHKQTIARALASHSNWTWAAAIIEMAKVFPAIRPPHTFYPTFLAAPLRFVLRGRVSEATNVLIYTDQLQINKDYVKKAIKLTCSTELEERELPYHLYHHPSASNAWLQVADYCAHAVYKKWEFGDTRLYDVLRSRLACEEMDILRNGACQYTHRSLR
jgi:hypothetical protein